MAYKLGTAPQTIAELGRPTHFKKGAPTLNPNGRPKSKLYIPDILRKLGEEDAPQCVSDELRKTFRRIGTINMREAYLRVVYLEAIAGEEWAARFIAERTEGKVKDGVGIDNKGAILDAIDKMIEGD